ncbi:imidazolonepropionase [Hydrogenophaga sp.]|jgi:imidazolonepropionase|uniref:imidazolonepropionase n=1 Tax=Hydrogenophaga sp. TaxID=1904254 RepID=UPI003F719C15
MTNLVLWRSARMATLTDNGWGLIDHGAMLTRGERIEWVGPASEMPAELRQRVDTEHDLGHTLVTPGLVDCHSHLVYAGNRAHEFELRLNGLSYEAIAQAGGGIRSTVAATRAATEEALFDSAEQRARRLMAEGVTTLEIKSGYGLSLEAEARCLRVARRLGRELPLSVQTTFLGAHAVPPDFDGRADEYIDAVCDWLPDLHAQGLVDAVDAFCDNIGFSLAHTRRVFDAARALGLPIKLHAEQLSNQHGAAMAASLGALSCDHLEHLSEADIPLMRRCGTVAVLLPGAFYFLRETRLPPVAALRTAGVPMAVSTDHNPGSSPSLSLLLMASMACTLFRLTPLEAVQGITLNAARALGLHDRGKLAPGQRADFVAWNLDHPNELAYWFGHHAVARTIQEGRERP